MKKYIYILILTATVGIIIVAPLKNHFMAEAQTLSYGQMFWGQPSGWGGGYGFQMAPPALFPQAEIASYNLYAFINSQIASVFRFTSPGFTSDPGMSGGGPGYSGGGSKPVPFGTSPPPYEPPVGVMIGDELYPLGFKFNYSAQPYSPSYPPRGEPGKLNMNNSSYEWPEGHPYSDRGFSISSYSGYYFPNSPHPEHEPQETDYGPPIQWSDPSLRSYYGFPF